LANSWQIGFLRSIPQEGKSENGRIFTGVILMVGLGGLEPPTSPLSVLRSLVMDLPVPVLLG
jgi:hypothetical protein